MESICHKVVKSSSLAFKNMNIERYARLKSIFPHDYVQIQFDLDSEQYQRAHRRYLKALEDLEFREDELTTYYAGNIGGARVGGCGCHRAFSIWDDEYVNKHRIDRFR